MLQIICFGGLLSPYASYILPICRLLPWG